MPRSLNKVMLIGNLGKDAETRHTQSGASVTNFTVATTDRWKDNNTGEWQERTEWHDVVVWRAENVAPYLKKGKPVFIEGRLHTRSWEDQAGQKRFRTEVICEPSRLMLLGGREGGSAPAQASSGQGNYGSRNEPPPQPAAPPQPAPATPAPEPAGSMGGMDDDDIPF